MATEWGFPNCCLFRTGQVIFREAFSSLVFSLLVGFMDPMLVRNYYPLVLLICPLCLSQFCTLQWVPSSVPASPISRVRLFKVNFLCFNSRTAVFPMQFQFLCSCSSSSLLFSSPLTQVLTVWPQLAQDSNLWNSSLPQTHRNSPAPASQHFNFF